MIGIDMKMPKSCEECDYYVKDDIMDYCYNNYCLVVADKNNVCSYRNERHPKCPLIDLDLDEEND